MSFFNRTTLLCSVALATHLACSPMPTQEAVLTLTAKPRTAAAGDEVTISIVAEDQFAKPGTGKVRVSSTAGSLVDGEEATLASGVGSIAFTCPASNAACKGSIKLTGEWTANGRLITATAAVTITAFDAGVVAMDAGVDAGVRDSGVPDAGAPDAGPADSGVVDGGGSNADGGGSTDAGPVDAGRSWRDAGLTLVIDAGFLVFGVGDSTPVVATLTQGGMPVLGEPIDFQTSTGSFALADGGQGSLTTVVTGPNGKAAATFLPTMATPTATIGATHAPSGLSANASVPLIIATQITFVSSVCAQTPMNCTLMGLRGSGFNTTATLKFVVRDAMNRPVPRVPVTFTKNMEAPTGLTVMANGVTDSTGTVTTSITSGLITGTFIITATIDGTTISANSGNIAIRGAKPTNKGMTLDCERSTLAALMSPTPPLALSMNCNVYIQDRFLNPIGTGTVLTIKTEAGNAPATVATTAFNPTMMSNPNEGKGTFVFSTTGTYPPTDVAPFTSDSAQYPFARAAEPSQGTGILRNPRDGLVTIIAYVAGGEEYFDDDNANGVQDGTEQFIDQGEPFVDRNDDNIWNTGEIYADLNGDNMWNGPNGTWDSNTSVWVDTRVLYVDHGDLAITPNTYDIAVGGSTSFNVTSFDANLNRPEGGSTYVAVYTGTRGTFSSMFATPILDGFGFRFSRVLVPPTGNVACDTLGPTRPAVCVYRTLFESWWQGNIGTARISNNNTNMLPTPTQFVVSGTTRGVVTTATASGTVR